MYVGSTQKSPGSRWYYNTNVPCFFLSNAASWEEFLSDAHLMRSALSRVAPDVILHLPDGLLVPAMEANGVLTPIEVLQFSGKRNLAERNRALLSCLLRKDSRTILLFFAVLKVHIVCVRTFGSFHHLMLCGLQRKSLTF